MPDETKRQHIDMRWLGSKLEQNSHHQLTLSVRWKMFWALDEDRRCEIRMWSQKIIKADIEARWVIQRQTYTKEEIK